MDGFENLAGCNLIMIQEAEAVAEAWNQEISRRIEELDSGKAKTIPWEEVRRKVTAKLSHGQ
jgi:putative addiction module component (TIGR02574 family)